MHVRFNCLSCKGAVTPQKITICGRRGDMRKNEDWVGGGIVIRNGVQKFHQPPLSRKKWTVPNWQTFLFHTRLHVLFSISSGVNIGILNLVWLTAGKNFWDLTGDVLWGNAWWATVIYNYFNSHILKPIFLWCFFLVKETDLKGFKVLYCSCFSVERRDIFPLKMWNTRIIFPLNLLKRRI